MRPAGICVTIILSAGWRTASVISTFSSLGPVATLEQRDTTSVLERRAPGFSGGVDPRSLQNTRHAPTKF